MSYGLISTGGSVKNQAMAGLKQSAQEETNRNIANKQIKAQEDTAKKTNAGAGAATGASIAAGAGASIGMGFATGGIGLVAGLVLSELF